MQNTVSCFQKMVNLVESTIRRKVQGFFYAVVKYLHFLFENLYIKSDFCYKTFRTLIDVSKMNFLLLQNASDLRISLISHNEPPPHLWVLSPTWVNHLPPSELNS